MALPKAFIAIEKTMSATMRVEWDRTAREFLKTLHPLIVDEKWHEAHDAVNKLSMRGVVSKVKAKIEELAVTAVLFGAHHVTGSVEETMLFKTKAIPQSLHHGVSQLVVAVEQNGGDYLRKQLHAVITGLQRKDEKAHVQKENPNHDAEGKFSSSPGGGGSAFDDANHDAAHAAVLTEHDVANSAPGGREVLSQFGNAVAIDALSYVDNKALMSEMHAAYASDPAYRQAADVVAAYQTNNRVSLIARDVVAQTLAGKTVEQISADPKVITMIATAREGMMEGFVSDSLVSDLAKNTPGYFETIRNAPDTTGVTFRGCKAMTCKEGQEIELRGPTAFSADQNAAMTYAGGTLIRVEAGAKMLPTTAMASSRVADEHATVPAFFKRSEDAVHPKGAGYGFSIDFDTDRELTTSGRFKVKAVTTESVTYKDNLTGKLKTRSMKVITLSQVGTF
jgi:hypothetical protein